MDTLNPFTNPTHTNWAGSQENPTRKSSLCLQHFQNGPNPFCPAKSTGRPGAKKTSPNARQKHRSKIKTLSNPNRRSKALKAVGITILKMANQKTNLWAISKTKTTNLFAAALMPTIRPKKPKCVSFQGHRSQNRQPLPPRCSTQLANRWRRSTSWTTA